MTNHAIWNDGSLGYEIGGREGREEDMEMAELEFGERRSGDERRQNTRRASDMDLTRLHADMQAMRMEIQAISKSLQKLAVQDERMSSIIVSMAEMKKELIAMDMKQDKLRQEHDKCPVGELKNDVSWLKWFVMGIAMAMFALVIGVIVHFVRQGGLVG